MNPFSGGHDTQDPATGHSTQKPTALYERALLNNSSPGDVLYDPFLGSGTAIIAAQKTGRRCLAIELEPRYVQMAISRWETYTGQTAAMRLAAFILANVEPIPRGVGIVCALPE